MLQLATLSIPALVGHRQVTDVHLLGLVAQRQQALATLDRGLLSFAIAVGLAMASSSSRRDNGARDRRALQGQAQEGLTVQISTFDPSSTTRFVGRLRKSAAAAALRCMPAKSFSRQSAMPPPIVGMTMSRDRK